MLSSRNLRATLRWAANGFLIAFALVLAVSLLLKAYSAKENGDVRNPAALGISDRQDVTIWRDTALASLARCSDSMDDLADRYAMRTVDKLGDHPGKAQAQMAEKLCYKEWRGFSDLNLPAFTEVVAQSRIDRAFRDCKLALHIQAKLAGDFAANSKKSADDSSSLRSAANIFPQASQQASACRSAMLTL